MGDADRGVAPEEKADVQHHVQQLMQLYESDDKDKEREKERERPRKRKSMWDMGSEGQVQPMVNAKILNPMNPMPPLAPHALIETRQARRMYVGNVPLDATSDELVAFLNGAMLQAELNKWAGQPVLACVHKGTGFCFVELRDVDEATELLKCDGALFKGESLTIRRPTNSIKQTGPNPQFPNMSLGQQALTMAPGQPNMHVWAPNSQRPEPPRNTYQQPSYQQVLQRFLNKDKTEL